MSPGVSSLSQRLALPIRAVSIFVRKKSRSGKLRRSVAGVSTLEDLNHIEPYCYLVYKRIRFISSASATAPGPPISHEGQPTRMAPTMVVSMPNGAMARMI